MRLIPLNEGKVAKVDDEDFDRVSKYTWKLMVARNGTGNPYARTWIKGQMLMHHFVLGSKIRTDHKDGDSLNNQKANLRPANRVQNARNRRIQKHSAPFKGVSLFKATGKWQASIRLATAPVQLRKVHLGFFETPEEAARAYDIVALKHFGEFARTNQQMGAL